MNTAPLDCLVVGAGPAGLTAAIYLARFRRRFLVADGGRSRAMSIPLSHNLPGYPEGLPGPELLARLNTQARRYGLPVIETAVGALTLADGVFEACLGERRVTARTVLLATGVVDHEPELPEVGEAVRRGLIRHCPVCDAYEVIDRTIAVIGHGKSGMGEALFLRHYSRDVTLLSLGAELRLAAEERERLLQAGIRLVEHPVDAVVMEEGRIGALAMRDGEIYRFDTIYSALGCSPGSGLAAELGAEMGDSHCVLVDQHQHSSVNGLFAAGDVASGLNQISVAMGQAAIASAAIHNRLRGAG